MSRVLGRFSRGHTPWNKGKKGILIGGVETQFKPGNKPHNTKFDGCITKRFHKGVPYLKIRICEKKWEYLHRHIWVEANGAIPDKHIVVFKDKNPLNCVLDNLECISLAENMRRNTIHKMPKELKEVVMLTGYITRQINKLTKKHGD